MIRLLVTMRVIENTGYPETRDAVAHDWARYLAGFDVLPVFVPNSAPDPAAYLREIKPSGLLLTGGNDLYDPASSAEQSASQIRDGAERRLLEAAVATRLPVFGVCRGLQMINHFFGGGISRRLPGEHVAKDHAVTLSGPQAVAIFSTEATVNSYHNQGVLKDQVAPPLESFAISADGVVEGLRHRDLPITAVQWHPERTNPSAALDIALFKEWLSSCA